MAELKVWIAHPGQNHAEYPPPTHPRGGEGADKWMYLDEALFLQELDAYDDLSP